MSLPGCVESSSPVPPVDALLAAAACWRLVGIAMLFLLFNVAVSAWRWMERPDYETQVKTLRPPDHLRPGRLAEEAEKFPLFPVPETTSLQFRITDLFKIFQEAHARTTSIFSELYRGSPK